jgi:hypothetical protein
MVVSFDQVSGIWTISAGDALRVMYDRGVVSYKMKTMKDYLFVLA